MNLITKCLKIGAFMCFTILAHTSSAQGLKVATNLGQLEGIEINSDNVFNYEIINGESSSKEVQVKGTLRYRNSSKLRFTYTYNIVLQPGVNTISKARVHNPIWQFSDNGFKDLFTIYRKMPQGTYEYCVEISFKKTYAEQADADPVSDCLYYTVNDIFLINLIDPENNAKLYEHYPLFSWVVNYPFASQLTYRIRVAELKKGQNNANAIARNNPVFQESNVPVTSKIYPVTAKPLIKFQPYVWTVDAYYKGILLGGAEPWRFTIIEDSVLKKDSVGQSYYEFEKHIAETVINAPGSIKLKYVTERQNDTLNAVIVARGEKEIALEHPKIPTNVGDNRIEIELFDKVNLGHKIKYELRIVNSRGKVYNIPFMYLNPLYTDEK